MSKHATTTRWSGWLGVLILAGITLFANLLFSRVLWRVDLTDEKLYTVSDGTRQLLADLDRDVTLKLFFSRSLEDVPIPIKQYAQRVEELLREYALHSKGRVAIETFDPRPDTDEEDWARRYGLASSPVGRFGAPFYLGMVAVSGARESVIPVFSPGQEPQLEYNVTRAIHEVTRATTPTIGIMTPLPVMQPPLQAMGRSPQRNWLFVSELRRLNKVEYLGPFPNEIPDDIDLLMVIQPKDIQPRSMYAIDQFILRGGRVMAFLDPWSMADQIISGSTPFARGGNVDPFNTLLNAWGLTLDTESLLADPTFATPLTSAGRPVNNVTWLSVRADGLNRDEVVTSMIDGLMLPGAGFFTGEPADGLTMTTLIAGSAGNGRVASGMAMLSDDGAPGSMIPLGMPQPIAVRLQGRFSSAFPDGLPEVEPPEGEPEERSSHLAQSVRETTVVLVADADILFDRFSVQAINVFGQTLFEPINDNLNFVINTAEQMTGSDALIGLRSRGSFARPFERVRALERAAEERWRQEETRLQNRMMDVQRMISEMQVTRDPSQQLILSPEQRAELDAVQEELFETRRQLQDVRRNLRRDIEQLGVRIKALNMAGVPVMIALVGIGRGLWRRRRH